MAGYTYLEYFKGTPRQTGRRLAALAGKNARTALPIFRKQVLPTAKKLGKDALQAALPKLHFLEGKIYTTYSLDESFGIPVRIVQKHDERLAGNFRNFES